MKQRSKQTKANTLLVVMITLAVLTTFTVLQLNQSVNNTRIMKSRSLEQRAEDYVEALAKVVIFQFKNKIERRLYVEPTDGLGGQDYAPYMEVSIDDPNIVLDLKCIRGNESINQEDDTDSSLGFRACAVEPTYVGEQADAHPFIQRLPISYQLRLTHTSDEGVETTYTAGFEIDGRPFARFSQFVTNQRTAVNLGSGDYGAFGLFFDPEVIEDGANLMTFRTSDAPFKSEEFFTNLAIAECGSPDSSGYATCGDIKMNENHHPVLFGKFTTQTQQEDLAGKLYDAIDRLKTDGYTHLIQPTTEGSVLVVKATGENQVEIRETVSQISGFLATSLDTDGDLIAIKPDLAQHIPQSVPFPGYDVPVYCDNPFTIDLKKNSELPPTDDESNFVRSTFTASKSPYIEVNPISEKGTSVFTESASTIIKDTSGVGFSSEDIQTIGSIGSRLRDCNSHEAASFERAQRIYRDRLSDFKVALDTKAQSEGVVADDDPDFNFAAAKPELAAVLPKGLHPKNADYAGVVMEDLHEQAVQLAEAQGHLMASVSQSEALKHANNLTAAGVSAEIRNRFESGFSGSAMLPHLTTDLVRNCASDQSMVDYLERPEVAEVIAGTQTADVQFGVELDARSEASTCIDQTLYDGEAYDNLMLSTNGKAVWENPEGYGMDSAMTLSARDWELLGSVIAANEASKVMGLVATGGDILIGANALAYADDGIGAGKKLSELDLSNPDTISFKLEAAVFALGPRAGIKIADQLLANDAGSLGTLAMNGMSAQSELFPRAFLHDDGSGSTSLAGFDSKTVEYNPNLKIASNQPRFLSQLNTQGLQVRIKWSTTEKIIDDERAADQLAQDQRGNDDE